MRRRFHEQIELLGTGIKYTRAKSGNVAAGMPEACDNPQPHRVAGLNHDNRSFSGCVLCRHGRPCVCDHDQVNLSSDELRRKAGQAVRIAFRRVEFETDVLTIGISEPAQCLSERLRYDPLAAVEQQANRRRFLLLCLATVRQSDGSGNHDEEMTPLHSMISLARAGLQRSAAVKSPVAVGDKRQLTI